MRKLVLLACAVACFLSGAYADDEYHERDWGLAPDGHTMLRTNDAYDLKGRDEEHHITYFGQVQLVRGEWWGWLEAVPDGKPASDQWNIEAFHWPYMWGHGNDYKLIKPNSEYRRVPVGAPRNLPII